MGPNDGPYDGILVGPLEGADVEERLIDGAEEGPKVENCSDINDDALVCCINGLNGGFDST